MLLVGINGCKKKDDSGYVSPLINKWRVSDAELGTQTSYYVFTADKRVLYLSNDSFNARGVTYGFFDDDNGKSVVLDLGYARSYQTVYSGDTCYLYTNPAGSPALVLVKDNSAPAETNWTPQPVYLDSLPSLSGNGGTLACYTGYLFETEAYINFVRAYSLSTGALSTANVAQQVTSFDLALPGVCYATKNSDSHLYNVALADLSTISTSVAAPNSLDAVAINGNSVYAYSQAEERMFTYDISGNTFDAGFACAPYTELAYANGYLYATRATYIDKIDVATKKVVKTWKVRTANYLDGIATDGTSFYVEVSYGFNDVGHIAKINLN